MHLEESQVGTEHGSTSQHNVSGSVDAGDGQLLTEVPNQVSEAVEGVEGEWESHGSLSEDFSSHWQCSKCRHDSSRVKWNRQERGGSVTTSQGVECTSHGHTGDSVDTRQVPSKLWLVNGQVWGNRTVSSLSDKKLILLLVGDLNGRSRSKSDSKRGASSQWGGSGKG